MPIYAYKCESCGLAKDVLQKMSDPVLSDCPACGQATFKKQLTAAGFQLKGTGWYATDFKGSTTSAPALATDAGAESKSDTKADVKTNNQPDSKASNTAPSVVAPAPAPAAASPSAAS